MAERKICKFYAVVRGDDRPAYWETSKARAILKAKGLKARKAEIPAVVRVFRRKFQCNLNTETFCLIYNDELDPTEELLVWSNLKAKESA